VEKQARAFVFEASPESLARTTLASKPVGARVHLERALRLGARLDGHLVQGHVDGVGVVLRNELVGNAWRVQVAPPPSVGRLLVPKGSVAINGVSLTLNEVDDDGGRFEVMVVPFTAQKTLMASLASGERVNLEADILGKYVLWFMRRGELSAKPALDGLLSEGDGELDDGAEGDGEGDAPREGDEGGRGGGVDLAFLRRHGFA
jgi:riboflavin synthase